MNDLIDILRVVFAFGVVIAPPIIVARLIAGPDRGSLADLLAFTTDEPWPRGVQEEDAPRWRVERARPHAPHPAEGVDVGCRPARPARISRAAS